MKFVLAALATWRVTHLLANEDGPADVIARFRSRLGDGLAARLIDCFNCLSVWVAAPAALYVSRKFEDWPFIWLALSGAGCLLERVMREPVTIQPILQETEGEIEHVLRSEAVGDERRNGNSSELTGPPGGAQGFGISGSVTPGPAEASAYKPRGEAAELTESAGQGVRSGYGKGV
ncbi:MAG TPA: hypothetical protein VFZ08_09340 [Terriglobia bacterium]|nr:hypothetical protein [Terriglobia bacterium]